MPAGAWAMSLLPVGMVLFLGVAWWLDTRIKRLQREEADREQAGREGARNERRGFEVITGTESEAGRMSDDEDLSGGH